MEFLLFLGPEECETIYGNVHGGFWQISNEQV
jgi:hypothetical protein